jgi:hypothetical protein
MRVIEHRKEMEARGYRLVQMWVPDDSNPTYLDELEREMESIKRADEIDRPMDWLSEFTDDVLADEPDFNWTGLGIDPYAGFETGPSQR